MTDTHENAERNLADNTRFRPLNELHERYYYNSLREALANKAELDGPAMQKADADTSYTV
jgi:hypothetical protein